MTTTSHSVGTLTPEEAVQMLHRIRRELGWVVAAFNDTDIHDALGREATDEELEAVMTGWYWNHLEDQMVEHGWTFVHNGIEEAGIAYAPEAEA